MPGGEDISRWIEAVRRRLVLFALAETALRLTGAVAAAVTVVVILDYGFEFPRWLRAANGIGMLLLAAGWAWRVGWRRWCEIPRSDGLALWVERQRPDLRSRLISSVQLSRVGWEVAEARAFVDRMRVDAGEAARRISLPEVVPVGRVRLLAIRALQILMVLGVFLMLLGPTAWILLRRALLEEVSFPRRTQIRDVTGALVVGRGEDVTLQASVEGVVPKSGRLVVRHEGGRVQELSFDAESPGAPRFTRILGGVPASFRYRIRINDADSDEFAVEVLPRPVLTNLVLTQILPKYTGALPRRVVPGELSILRGSRLRVEGTAGQPLREARVRLSGIDRVIELGVGGDSMDRVVGEIPMDLATIGGFSVELTDRRGIPSRDPAVYALNVVEDKPPEVRIVVPSRREDLVTTHGTELISFEAKDDFGLGALRLRFEAASSTNGSPATIDLDMAGGADGVVRRRFDWRLVSLQPPLVEGAMVEFWIEAVDRNDVDGPGVGRSERYLLRVVTEAEKRADLLGRAGDAIGRLGDVAQGQERLNDSLGRLILARPAAP